MGDVVASSGEVSDCNQLNTSCLTLALQWGQKDAKALSGVSVWVCPFWSTLGTRQCNIADSVEEEQRQHNNSEFQRIIHLWYKDYIPFLPPNAPKSYKLDLQAIKWLWPILNPKQTEQPPLDVLSSYLSFVSSFVCFCHQRMLSWQNLFSAPLLF